MRDAAEWREGERDGLGAPGAGSPRIRPLPTFRAREVFTGRAGLDRLPPGSTVASPAPDDFRLAIAAADYGDLYLAEVEHTALRIETAPTLWTPAADFGLTFAHRGASVHTIDDTPHALDEGRVLVRRAHQRVVSTCGGDVVERHLAVSSARLEARGADGLLDALPALLPDSALLRSLDALIGVLVTDLPEPYSVAALSSRRVLEDLVAAVVVEWSTRRADDGAPVDRGYLAALRYIADHVHEPSLGAARLARGIAVSPRHLNRVFAEHGSSPAAAIRALRLDRARDALLAADPRATLASIAVRSGFASAEAMRRAFLGAGEETPAALRALGARGRAESMTTTD